MILKLILTCLLKICLMINFEKNSLRLSFLLPLYFFLSAPKWLLLAETNVILDVYWFYELSFAVLIFYISSQKIEWHDNPSSFSFSDIFFLGLLISFLAMATWLGVDSLERLVLVFTYVYIFLRIDNPKVSLIIFLFLAITLNLLFDVEDFRDSPLYGEGFQELLFQFFKMEHFGLLQFFWFLGCIQHIFGWVSFYLPLTCFFLPPEFFARRFC